MRISVSILIVALFLLSHPGWAQISSDRPGQALSAKVVGKGILQHQSGFDLFENKTNQYWNRLGEGFRIDNGFRYGISTNMELGIGFIYQKEDIRISDTINFSEELKVLGLKFRSNLLRNGNTKHALAYEVEINWPFYNIDTDNPEFGAKLSIMSSHDLGRSFGLAVNVSSIASPQGKFTYSYVVNLGYGITDKLSAFVEHYAIMDPEGIDWDGKYDGGLAYLINKDLQIDLFRGYDRNATDQYEWFTSFGVSWRVPTL